MAFLRLRRHCRYWTLMQPWFFWRVLGALVRLASFERAVEKVKTSQKSVHCIALKNERFYRYLCCSTKRHGYLAFNQKLQMKTDKLIWLNWIVKYTDSWWRWWLNGTLIVWVICTYKKETNFKLLYKTNINGANDLLEKMKLILVFIVCSRNSIASNFIRKKS